MGQKRSFPKADLCAKGMNLFSQLLHIAKSFVRSPWTAIISVILQDKITLPTGVDDHIGRIFTAGGHLHQIVCFLQDDFPGNITVRPVPVIHTVNRRFRKHSLMTHQLGETTGGFVGILPCFADQLNHFTGDNGLFQIGSVVAAAQIQKQGNTMGIDLPECKTIRTGLHTVASSPVTATDITKPRKHTAGHHAPPFQIGAGAGTLPLVAVDLIYKGKIPFKAQLQVFYRRTAGCNNHLRTMIFCNILILHRTNVVRFLFKPKRRCLRCAGYKIGLS